MTLSFESTLIPQRNVESSTVYCCRTSFDLDFIIQTKIKQHWEEISSYVKTNNCIVVVDKIKEDICEGSRYFNYSTFYDKPRKQPAQGQRPPNTFKTIQEPFTKVIKQTPYVGVNNLYKCEIFSHVTFVARVTELNEI